VSDWINTIKQSVGGNPHAEINAPDAGMLLTDNELVYINISGMQRARLAEIAKVSKENGELVISSVDHPLIRGPIKADKETLSNFFSQVRQVAAWSRERRTVIMDSPSATPMDSSFMGRSQDAPFARPDMPDPIAEMPAPAPRPVVMASQAPSHMPPPPMLNIETPSQLLGRGVNIPPVPRVDTERPRVMTSVVPRFSENRMETVPLEFAGFWMRFFAHIIDVILLSIASGLISNLFTGSSSAALTRLSLESNNDPETISRQLEAILPSFVTSLVLATVAVTVLTWLYYALMESGERQGTLGKMALGLVVTTNDNQRLGFAQASGRYVAKSIVPFTMTLLSLLSIVPAITALTANSVSENTSTSGLEFVGNLFGTLGLIFTIGGLALLVSYVMAGFTAKKQALHDIIAKTLVLKK
jgi:uncharacterized RDD family membrane protein YckC